jgi:hypothetical protein
LLAAVVVVVVAAVVVLSPLAPFSPIFLTL